MGKRVYIAYTGGTIGMRRTLSGYAPAPGYLEEQLLQMPKLHHPSLPETVIHEYEPLLDSADMMPGDWVQVAKDIADHHDDYDGFVVLHGTDTMAYTASALAFLLEGLRKPVILTGSQIPLFEVRNDARTNLVTSLILAADEDIPEVCLCFGNRLYRGCRSTKVDAEGFGAFASPNFPALGTVGTEIDLRRDLIRKAPPPGLPIIARDPGAPAVAALRLFPGISAGLLTNLLRPPLKGLVLETYGVGNGPSRDRAFLKALESAAGSGVVIVNCSQCLRGQVQLGDYATGTALARAGVLSGGDMTPEAALTKLAYLFGTESDSAAVGSAMQRDLRGELTAGQ